MAKFDEALVARLAGLSKAESDAEIAKLKLSMTDETFLKVEVNSRRDRASHPAPSAAGDDLAALLGVGGVGSAVVVGRVAELLAGKTMRYEGRLEQLELIGRLRTKMGDKYAITFNAGVIRVLVAQTYANLAEIRLSYDLEATNVTISRANTDKAKDAAGDIASQAVRQATRPGGFGLGSLLNIGQKAVAAVVDTASDLSEMNTLVTVVEDYGAEVEQATLKARREARDEEAQKAERERLKTQCANCGSKVAEDAAVCPQCGAPHNA